jgi:hypothetical protein
MAHCTQCSYDPNLASGMICGACSTGYAVIYSGQYGYTSNACIACPSGCVSCEFDIGLGSACGAGVPSNMCGTNGLVCGQCAAGYANVNYNCYACSSTTITEGVPSSSTGNNSGLVIGLSVWGISTTILASNYALR